jgi:hypothetical protein
VACFQPALFGSHKVQVQTISNKQWLFSYLYNQGNKIIKNSN